MTYLAVKALHIIAWTAWIAAMLIYPRYKVHQLAASPGEPLFERMRDASGQLRRIILTPAMLAAWALGIAMLVMNPALLEQGWIHIKIALVLVLTGLHGWFMALGKRADAMEAPDPALAKRLRMLNELPFLLLIAIVLLAILKLPR